MHASSAILAGLQGLLPIELSVFLGFRVKENNSRGVFLVGKAEPHTTALLLLLFVV